MMWNHPSWNNPAFQRRLLLRLNLAALAISLLAPAWFVSTLYSQEPAAQAPKFPPETGVQTPGIQRDIATLAPIATFVVKGHPDWLAVAGNAVWVASSNVNHVVRLDAQTNLPGTIITVAEPCSGMAVEFGSLWIPSCGDNTLVRADAETGAIQARIPAGPAESEGGIAVGSGSVWLVTSKTGELDRIDPATNSVVGKITIPPGSFNPVFANDSIWVSSNKGNALVRVNPATNTVVSSTPIGPMPRFLTVGAGSVWVLNQGDGSISRVDATTGKLIATIQAGIPGFGGEIAFGADAVWATVFKFPITRIDPATNTVVEQWHGPGGDSIRFAHGSLWLTSYSGERVWRLDVPPKP
jgi:virginiamycin B lyase